MQTRHRNAENVDRPLSFNLNAMSILSFCRAIDCGNSSPDEPDMFSRWIRLSDDLLAANWKPRKRVSNRGRRNYQVVALPNPA